MPTMTSPSFSKRLISMHCLRMAGAFFRSRRPLRACSTPWIARTSTSRCFIVANLFPYSGGHVMVATRRHVGSLGEATVEELGEMMSLARRLAERHYEQHETGPTGPAEDR